MRRWKKISIVTGLLIGSFFIYVQIVNRHSKEMTGKQKFLKAVYPLWIGFTKLIGKNTNMHTNTSKAKPQKSFYELTITLNNGQPLALSSLKGKKVLLVNTASNCGYTGQYAALQELSEKFASKLTIVGFPANDFAEQEKGDDEAIAQFCKVNFGVTFPLAQKNSVINSPEQQEMYKWLTDKKANGWNDQQPTWNFAKYLVDEEGVLTDYFDPSITPEDVALINAIGK